MNDLLLSEWLEDISHKLCKRQKKADPKKARHFYPHLDLRISAFDASKLVSDPAIVAKHVFLPFLREAKKVRKLSLATKGVVKPKCQSTAFKPRNIDKSAHLDAFIYSWYSFQLQKIYDELLEEEGISKEILAYREHKYLSEGLTRGKCNNHFSAEVFNFVQSIGPCTALCFDVKDFFPSLKHESLLDLWKDLLHVERLPADHFRVFKSITGTTYIWEEQLLKHLSISKKKAQKLPVICSMETFNNSVRDSNLIKYDHKNLPWEQRLKSGRGIPQGSAMSGLLSNLYMLPFDRHLIKETQKVGGMYRRYSDDIICVVPNSSASDLEKIIRNKISEPMCDLRLSDAKTEIIYFENNASGLLKSFKLQNTKKLSAQLQYLGHAFDGQNRSIRSKTVSRNVGRMRRAVKREQLHQAKRIRLNRKKGITSEIPLNLGRVFKRFSAQGKSNFFSYVDRAQKTMGNPPSFKRQKKNLKKKMLPKKKS